MNTQNKSSNYLTGRALEIICHLLSSSHLDSDFMSLNLYRLLVCLIPVDRETVQETQSGHRHFGYRACLLRSALTDVALETVLSLLESLRFSVK